MAADGSARFALFPEREVTDMNVDMNLDKRKCSACGGSVSIQSFDTSGIHFMCEACGKEDTSPFEMTFVSTCSNGGNGYIAAEWAYEYGG